MSLSACNAVVNPSFESGVLFPWRASAANVATVSNADSAYSGEYYLNLQTAIDNGGNTISQNLENLKRGTKYDFSAEVQIPGEGASYCLVYVYMGRNETIGQVATEYVSDFEKWVSVTGSYTPKRSEDRLSIIAACDFEDNSVTGRVYIDDVIFAPSGSCGSN
ncbi:hypothetical protein N7448_004268 [Penicillium atrosanguineum]|uniref:CBM-cenC domain-containing protein n=1 Tax=Penicillium atrosanguineum TaxID=1132637 RepID=A0A9W9H8V7_9EURO|nr:uncharacterized protein N7443_003233 [Penicillium atrosanguineum]KAJ5118085.1 hypothetical protein N7526_011108 [Penicillium atrosanguineum]KAJ5140860.1 hypothetical protein N7448_004268 [Penicillium atrosanguineum]KAJ5310772.1 hypothetical protein N7443_003233 [Penicillium atrosanguineum]KAJ5316296.1 hypothetical protein N7476_006603 [Penicillium atrosanguineum]